MFQKSEPTSKPNQWMLWLLLPIAVFALFVARPDSPKFNVTNITVQEAKALVDQGTLVIDVREPEKFEHRHIPGALLVPLAVLRVSIPESLTQAKGKPIVVYCGDGVTTGPEGTAILNKAGFTGAVNVEAGIQGWADAGHPVARGK